jgi:hypothetical protein
MVSVVSIIVKFREMGVGRGIFDGINGFAGVR